MPLLTADDVHYKTFTPTKFREGYDQDEVDEFLDQVVDTLAKLQEENQTLRNGGEVPAAPVPAAEPHYDADTQELQAQLEAANQQILELQNQAGVQAQQLDEAHKQLEAAQASQQAPQVDQPAAEADPTDATGMLALAQRVHDEYVRSGEEEGNQIVADSRLQGEQIVREANSERQRILDKLESERTELEQKVDELRNFESEYRQQIQSHLESLMRAVEANGDN